MTCLLTWGPRRKFWHFIWNFTISEFWIALSAKPILGHQGKTPLISETIRPFLPLYLHLLFSLSPLQSPSLFVTTSGVLSVFPLTLSQSLTISCLLKFNLFYNFATLALSRPQTFILAKVKTVALLLLLLVCRPPPGEWFTLLGGGLAGGLRVCVLFFWKGGSVVLSSERGCSAVREVDLSLPGPGLGAVMRWRTGLPDLSLLSLRWSRSLSFDLEEDDSFLWLSLLPSVCLWSFPTDGEVGVFTLPGPLASPLAYYLKCMCMFLTGIYHVKFVVGGIF